MEIRNCKILLCTILVLVFSNLTGQQRDKEVWLDSVMASMSTEEKIGQIFTIRAFSKEDPDHIRNVKEQIDKYHIGGICFFQGNPEKQAQLVNEYQEMSKFPLLISIDGEWGMGMRFPGDAISFPKQLTIGAINDHQLIYLMGKEIGRQCRLTGVQMNFAPVVDINSNSANPVINIRSFGEDRFNVSAKAYAYMKGMQDAGILSCAKHFPGHGDTDVDSHHDLPVISHQKRRLDSIELFPFNTLIRQGINSIMVAHLQIPVLDDRPNRPTTVSENVVQKLLREEMNFNGLIFTDAMEMKGVTKYFEPGEADLAAFLAGNDVILLPENIHEAVAKVVRAVEAGIITSDRLDESVRRIISAKYDLGLHVNRGWASQQNLTEELNSKNAQVIKARIYEKAMTLVSNEEGTLPLRELSGRTFASVSLGASGLTTFQKRMHSYTNVAHKVISKSASPAKYAEISEQVVKKDVVLISLHGMSRHASRNFGLTDDQVNFIKTLSGKTKVILTLFGSPYALRYFEDVPTTLVAYEEDPLAQEAAAQAIFGAYDITGRLPVSASSGFRVDHGINLPGLNRIGYSIPEAVGLHSDTLKNIEKLALELIEEKAAPGCQILVAKDNKIVFHKSFGHHTYERKTSVQKDDIYDVASLTKILASTVSIMHLQDQGLMNLNDPIAKFIPGEDTTNKASLIYEDMMAHVSGLPGWIPFYINTLDTEKTNLPSSAYYSQSLTDGFEIRVTPNLYLRTDYRDTIWRKIFSSSLRTTNNYRYSDLSFYIINRTIQNITGGEVDAYAEKNFYRPMGLRRTLFNPHRLFDESLIPPSEHDQYWRNAVIRGTVHDMGAAMLGGVSGHAGLFSNSLEIAIVMQMLLNEGYYGGIQYIKPNTVRYYTQRHWRSSRRGIGFDMKELNPERSLNMSEKASRHTFGHTGFTGTAAYADPDYNIVYVFLSNRTFPSMKNNKLGKEEYRSRIQSVIYDALMIR